MFWGDQFYGGHTGKAIERTGTTWYLAEGAANGFFATFILLANPGSTPGDGHGDLPARAVGHLHQGVTASRPTRASPSTPTRCTDGTGGRPLNGRSFSTQVSSTVPIAVERAMYFTNARVWNGGHEAAAVPAPRTNWYVAEGATGELLHDVPAARQPERVADDRDDPLPAAGRQRRDADAGRSRPRAAPRSRSTPSSPPATSRCRSRRRCRSSSNGRCTGQAPTGARRTPAPALPRPVTSGRMAEGEVGGSRGFQTYILIANPTASAATVRLRFLRENGTSFVTPDLHRPGQLARHPLCRRVHGRRPAHRTASASACWSSR